PGPNRQGVGPAARAVCQDAVHRVQLPRHLAAQHRRLAYRHCPHGQHHPHMGLADRRQAARSKHPQRAGDVGVGGSGRPHDPDEFARRLAAPGRQLDAGRRDDPDCAWVLPEPQLRQRIAEPRRPLCPGRIHRRPPVPVGPGRRRQAAEHHGGAPVACVRLSVESQRQPRLQRRAAPLRDDDAV
ncbi:hypothetical protein FBU59_002080, partial [Linderina macrospora]